MKATTLLRNDHSAVKKLDFSRPGKPADNAYAESFNATVRRGCLSQHWFRDFPEVKHTLCRWKEEYNNDRPLQGRI